MSCNTPGFHREVQSRLTKQMWFFYSCISVMSRVTKSFLLWHDYICHISRKSAFQSHCHSLCCDHISSLLLITSLSFSLSNILFTDPCCFPLLDTTSQRLSSEIFASVMCNQLNWITLAHKLQHMAQELFLLALLNETKEHVWCVNTGEVGTIWREEFL